MEQKNNIMAIILTIVITAVVVGGGMYWWQTKTEQTDSAKVTTETKQNLKIYTSSQFQYSLQYPQDWFLTKGSSIEAQPEVVLISKQELLEGAGPDPELYITINRSSLEDNIRKNLISREEITFAGQSATQIKFTGDFGPPIISVLIPYNNYTFVISYDPEDEDYTKIKSILNSFSFTD